MAKQAKKIKPIANGKEKYFLLAYLIALFLIIAIKNIYALAGIIVLLALISGKNFLPIAGKVLVSILLFNLIISLSYLIARLSEGKPWLDYILLINLRVFAATYFTFLFVSKINFFKALEFSPSLSFIFIIAYSQIINYKRIYENFKQAFKSRNLNSLKTEWRYNFLKSVFFCLFRTALHSSDEISLSMKSRCFNVDKN